MLRCGPGEQEGCLRREFFTTRQLWSARHFIGTPSLRSVVNLPPARVVVVVRSAESIRPPVRRLAHSMSSRTGALDRKLRVVPVEHATFEVGHVLEAEAGEDRSSCGAAHA